MSGWRRGGGRTHISAQVLAGWGHKGGALYLVVQRAEVLEASEAGVAQADQDGEQQDQEVKQCGGGRQPWGRREAALEVEGGWGGAASPCGGGAPPGQVPSLWGRK